MQALPFQDTGSQSVTPLFRSFCPSISILTFDPNLSNPSLTHTGRFDVCNMLMHRHLLPPNLSLFCFLPSCLPCPPATCLGEFQPMTQMALVPTKGTLTRLSWIDYFDHLTRSQIVKRVSHQCLSPKDRAASLSSKSQSPSLPPTLARIMTMVPSGDSEGCYSPSAEQAPRHRPPCELSNPKHIMNANVL